MSLSKSKVIIITISVFVLSIFSVSYLTPDYHPDGGFFLKLSKDEISVIASKVIKNYRADLQNEKFDITLQSNPAILRYFRSTNRLDSANMKIRNQKLSYYWLIKVLSVNDTDIVIASEKDDNLKKSTVLELKISQEGKLFSLAEVFNETKITDYLSEDSAKLFIENTIASIADYISFTNDSNKIQSKSYLFVLDKIELIQKLDRKDYNFTWKGFDESGQLLYLKAGITGNRFKFFDVVVPVPEDYSKSEIDIYEIVITIFSFLFVLIMVIAIGIKRIKAYEIGYRNAIVVAIIYAFFFILAQILDLSSDFPWNILLGIALVSIFIFLATTAVWAVGETFLREEWNEKFSSFDLLRHKYFTHSIVGKFLSFSVSAGLFLTATYLLIIKIESQYFYLNFNSKAFQSLNHFNSDFPLLYLLSSSISSSFLIIIPILFFISGSIKKYFNDRIIFISVNSVLLALFIYLFIEPVFASLIVSLAIGLIISLIFFEFDLLTTIVSFILFNFFLRAVDFSFAGNEAFTNNWTITILISSLLIIIGFVLILTKDKSVEINSLAPKFLENITERQRMKKELEVARVVQMSFLPKKNPVLNGIQISSVCVPAYEVGGDYYDFIKLSDNKIGIIIGDVSGKGTQAAFYMTLAKGFIKAIAKESDSPADILSKMNELFYENVERGRFISMIYAIVDLEKRVIKIARAGHNPVLINQSTGKINLITPKGLALGLEKGIIFRKVITEETINLEKGNTFVFYTDGFTEAVNHKGEEFGLERIQKIVEQYSYESAEKILENLLGEVKKFIGKTHQYDDMTMVILKVSS